MKGSTRTWTIIGTLKAAQAVIAKEHAGLRYRATYERDPQAGLRFGGHAWKVKVVIL